MFGFPPAGWYPDGTTIGVVRWFDGRAWTEHVMAEPLHKSPHQADRLRRADDAKGRHRLGAAASSTAAR